MAPRHTETEELRSLVVSRDTLELFSGHLDDSSSIVMVDESPFTEEETGEYFLSVEGEGYPNEALETLFDEDEAEEEEESEVVEADGAGVVTQTVDTTEGTVTPQRVNNKGRKVTVSQGSNWHDVARILVYGAQEWYTTAEINDRTSMTRGATTSAITDLYQAGWIEREELSWDDVPHSRGKPGHQYRATEALRERVEELKAQA